MISILGGGMYVKSNNVWYVKGIFSAFAIDDEGSCDWSNYGVYTKVSEYIDWIDEVMTDFPSSLSDLQYNKNIPVTKPYNDSSEMSVAKIPLVAMPQPFRSFRTDFHCNYKIVMDV